MQGGGALWKGHGPPQRLHRGLRGAAEVTLEEDLDEDEIMDLVQNGSELEDEPPERWRNLFVTCNGNTVRIYEAIHKQKPSLIQLYEDSDPNEQFYCVAWTFNVTGKHEYWVCAAGRKGIIRVIDVQNFRLCDSLTGHGDAINDIKVHPQDPALVITASKDESLRLWNLRTGATCAIFCGLKGHRGEVVHVDFSQDGSRFASCGIDNSVRLWDFYDNEDVVRGIKESHKAADLGATDPHIYTDETGTRRKIKVPISQFPYFVTRKVHRHYVDCVIWVGELLLSKSVHNRMILWEPEKDRESLASPATEYTLLEEYVLDVCSVWFIRFAMDRFRRLVACGNDKVREKTHKKEVSFRYGQCVRLGCNPV
ncbi:Polycomb protein EED [Gracilaria domingensis]|nr:Polycomb protein EED [Gracilaria domingensis]